MGAKSRKSLFPMCKTSIGNNCASVTQIAVKFACRMGFSDMADRMIWPHNVYCTVILQPFAVESRCFYQNAEKRLLATNRCIICISWLKFLW